MPSDLETDPKDLRRNLDKMQPGVKPSLSPVPMVNALRPELDSFSTLSFIIDPSSMTHNCRIFLAPHFSFSTQGKQLEDKTLAETSQ